jgi:hypothetical protein
VTKTTNERGRNRVTCPHCEAAAHVRSSRAVTDMVRQLFYACTNFECGCTFGAQLEITHQISPSARPNPAVMLRTAPPRHRIGARPANDNRVAANDAGGLEVPPILPANDQESERQAL